MVYIHIPYCIKKCLYCDFFSVCDRKSADEYKRAVIKEIEKCPLKETQTVYIGGGTPTSIGSRLLDIVYAVKKHFSFLPGYEFTVEANPKTVDISLLEDLRAAGINRISLGAQSFVEEELSALGRAHGANDIFEAVRLCRDAGFYNISLDLMLAIPGQTPESLDYSLSCIEKTAPKHVSAYSLIVEENTPFYNMELNLPDEDTERKMYWHTADRLKKMGLMQYEISNYAAPGYESLHNMRYWQDYEYYGIGAGAHSYADGYRWQNVCDIQKYIAGSERENVTKISPHERKLELFMLGLRLTRGIEYNGEFPERVQPLIKKGLLENRHGRLRLTRRGTDLANLVFMEFLDD